VRPDKPENAPAIGFSDILWDFTQRCWDGEAESRPKVGEVVTHLRQVASNWDRLMPPCVQAKGVASGPEETSDSKTWGESEIYIHAYYSPLNHGADPSPQSLDDTPESPTKSSPSSGSPTTPNTPPPQLTGQPWRESQKVDIEPPEVSQPDSLVSMHPRMEEPHDLHVAEIYPHHN